MSTLAIGFWTPQLIEVDRHPWMDSIIHAASGGMWHVMWILMIEEKWIFEDDNVN
jgi:hypothetical protein